MRGSYLNDPCRGPAHGEPDDEPASVDPNPTKHEWRVVDSYSTGGGVHDSWRALGPWRETEREAHLDAEHGSMRGALPDGPSWLADAAEALGLVRPSDGAPLALNWTQVIEAIRELRVERDELEKEVDELSARIGGML